MPNKILLINSPRSSPRRTPRRSPRRTPRRSPRRTPRRSPRRTPKKLSKKQSKKNMTDMKLTEQKGGKPIRVPIIPLNLSLSNLQSKIDRLFKFMPISDKIKKNIRFKINKYEMLINNLVIEFNKYNKDKSTVGVRATDCYREDSQICLDKSCDVSRCTNRYSVYLHELTGIKRCFDHWKITGYLTLMKTINDYSHYYYQRRVASTIMGPQEGKAFDDHSWDETIALTMNSILTTVSQKIITKFQRPNISKIGRKILRDKARRARQAKMFQERASSRKTISRKTRSKKTSNKKKSRNKYKK